MKNTFAIFLFVVFASTMWGQVDATIDKGSGWLYFTGIPGTTPSITAGSEVAINTQTREAYVWNRDSSEWQKWLLVDSLTYSGDTLRLYQNGGATALSVAIIPPGVDSLTYSSDTLRLYFGGVEYAVEVQSGSLDSVSYYGDTLRVYFGGNPTPYEAEIKGGIYGGSGTVPASTWAEQLGSLIFDIDSLGSFTVGDIDEKNTGAFISVSNTGGNDGQITLRSGSGGGYTDATVQVNNYQLPGNTPTAEGLPSGDYFWIVSQAGVRKGQDSTGWIHIDSLLSGYPTGSGTAGTLPIWTGANTLGNSSLTEGSGVLSSSLTGALKLPAGTDAQDPVWSAGMLRYNTTVNGLQGYDGTAERFLPWADADNYANYRIPYSNGISLTSSADLYYNDAGDGVLYLNISDGIGIDASSTSLGDYSVSIGGRAAGSYGVAIGFNSSVSTSEGIAIGNGAVANASSAIAIGNSADATQSSTLAIGKDAQSTAQNSIAIGGSATQPGAICITPPLVGTGSATHKCGIAIGINSETTAEFQLVIGGTGDTASSGETGEIKDIYFGSGVQRSGYNDGAGENYTINGSGARGTNQTGGNITIAGGKGTGTGTPGHISFSISTPGASGSTLQTLTEKARIQRDSFFLYGYGSGNITGTPAKSISVTSAGKLIETAEKYAAISTTTDASGDVTVTHGMGTTPTSVQVTVTGTTPYVVTVHTIGATTFTVRFYDMAGVALNAVAVTATWHAKT